MSFVIKGSLARITGAVALTGILFGCGGADDPSASSSSSEGLTRRPPLCRTPNTTTVTPFPDNLNGATLAATYPVVVRAGEAFDFTLEVHDWVGNFPAPYTGAVVTPTLDVSVSGATPASATWMGEDIPFTQGVPVPVWASVSESLTPTGAAGSQVQVLWSSFSYFVMNSNSEVFGPLGTSSPTPVPVATIPVAAPLPTSVLDCQRAWRERSDCEGQAFANALSCIRLVSRRR